MIDYSEVKCTMYKSFHPQEFFWLIEDSFLEWHNRLITFFLIFNYRDDLSWQVSTIRWLVKVELNLYIVSSELHFRAVPGSILDQALLF